MSIAPIEEKSSEQQVDDFINDLTSLEKDFTQNYLHTVYLYIKKDKNRSKFLKLKKENEKINEKKEQLVKATYGEK